MNYCKPIDANTAEKYNLRQLKADFPDVSFPKSILDGSLDEATLNARLVDYGVYPYNVPAAPVFDTTIEAVQESGILNNAGVWTLQWLVVLLTQAELDELAANKKREDKLAGVLFEGVMCSATAEDMWGLKSVEDYVAAGMDTPFKFDNGNVLVLTQTNMAAFQAVWVPFRASFF